MKTSVTIPLALLFSVITGVGGAGIGAGVVRSDVGHLADRISLVEQNVNVVSREVEELRMVQTGDRARDGEWRLSVERRLSGIETMMGENTQALQDVRDLLRRRR
jgi:hypothetical protein